MLENWYCTLSVAALSLLVENGVAVFVCDDLHLPNGVLIPFNAHHRQLKVLKQQMNISKPFCKRIWQNLIKQKIKNQAMCLGVRNKEEMDLLLNLARRVESGDASHLESTAASIYFKALFGKEFTRQIDNIINSSLNYAYALVRGAISRVLVSYGLTPCLGIFHRNELNPFNLSDDFIEPYRGIVDLFVLNNVPLSESDLSPECKKILYNIFNHQVEMPDGIYTLTSSIDAVVSSFINCLNTEDYTGLQLPSLI